MRDPLCVIDAIDVPCPSYYAPMIGRLFVRAWRTKRMLYGKGVGIDAHLGTSYPYIPPPSKGPGSSRSNSLAHSPVSGCTKSTGALTGVPRPRRDSNRGPGLAKPM